MKLVIQLYWEYWSVLICAIGFSEYNLFIFLFIFNIYVQAKECMKAWNLLYFWHNFCLVSCFLQSALDYALAVVWNRSEWVTAMSLKDAEMKTWQRNLCYMHTVQLWSFLLIQENVKPADYQNSKSNQEPMHHGVKNTSSIFKFVMIMYLLKII